MLKVLVLDNYDSFTYNLVHYVEQFTDHVDVFRNDKISLADVDNYDAIIISPGPGLPSDAGITLDLIKEYSSRKKILGVCLGHQAIAEAFGGSLKNLNQVLHGVSLGTIVKNNSNNLFKSIPNTIICGRYHSWVIDENDFPEDLEITAIDEESNIMALQHKLYDVHGVQFHPESIMTEHGLKMIENWITK